MRFSSVLFTLACLAGISLASFVVTSSQGRFIVDANGGFVFSVSQTTGDIVSLVYKGIETQDSSKASHIGSGLGRATVTANTVNNYIRISVVTSSLTHYYIAKDSDPTLYMGTYITAEPSAGELRFIARLKKSVLSTGIAAAQVDGGTVIEGSDVFLVDGQTRSKFFSSVPFIDDSMHCVTGSDIGACMVIGSYESSSGGPFFRDINNQGTSQQEVYFYMNSGHVQTEAYRMGFHGPYALRFTNGEMSDMPNFDFYQQLSLTGYVPSAERGLVSGTVSGVTDGVVHWYNNAAQYWVRSDGEFTSPLMKPGTYTMVLYKGELKVAETSVTVNARETVSKSISSAQPILSGAIFRIGTVDGRPSGFMNAEKQQVMHPSDSRMSSWAASTFIVGKSTAKDFPMAQIKSVNDPTTISFTLTSDEAAIARTVKIYTTLSFSGGRPSVKVNGYSPAAPAAPKKIDSRGFTRGAYRGYGEVYTFDIPTRNLVAGANSIQISCISGNTGTTFLNPNFIYDAVDFY